MPLIRKPNPKMKTEYDKKLADFSFSKQLKHLAMRMPTLDKQLRGNDFDS